MSEAPTKKRPAPAAKTGKRGQNRCSAETISEKRFEGKNGDGHVYGTSALKPKPVKRRTRAEIAVIETAVLAEIERQTPVTLRQLFYLLVGRGTIGKLEREYRALARITKAMRERGTMRYEDLTDSTRWARQPVTHDSLASCLQLTAKTYRRALWNSQTACVEVWSEKDTLTGSLYPTTSEWDVPLMVCRGFSSLSFVHSAAEYIKALHKPTYIYYVGDWDPSGKCISDNVERKLREFSGDDVELHFERLAVTERQIEELQLPTQPPKTSDTRSKSFIGQTVQADAIEPTLLRTLVRNAIEQHIDRDILERTKLIEQREREAMEGLSYDYEPTAGDEDDD